MIIWFETPLVKYLVWPLGGRASLVKKKIEKVCEMLLEEIQIKEIKII